MRKNKRKQPVAVYKLDSLPYQFIGWMVLALFFLLPAIFGDMAFRQLTSGNWLGILWLGAAIYCLFRNIWFVFQEVTSNRLLIFDTGLEFQLYGIQAFAYWDELGHFGWKKHRRGELPLWGIWVDETITESESSCAKIFLLKKRVSFDDFIPLHYWESILRNSNRPVNLERFKKTPLGSDLYYYAPHLFDEAEANKPKHTPA